MDDNLVLKAYLLVHKEVADIGSLVSRELQNLTKLDILIDATVALKGFLQCLGDLLDVQILCQALDRGDTFAAISLLHADVNL